MARILKAVILVATCAGLAAGACAAPATGQGKQGKQGKKDAGVAARVGDKTISIDEVDERARASSSEVYQQLYQARRTALDAMVADLLLDQEAAARGVSRNELIQQEINAKSPAVSAADIEAFYNQNKSRMGDQTLEAMSTRIQQFLVNQNTQKARTDFISQLKAKAGVKIALDPPRVDVRIAENDPSKGPADAPILLVEFSEFQ